MKISRCPTDLSDWPPAPSFPLAFLRNHCGQPDLPAFLGEACPLPFVQICSQLYPDVLGWSGFRLSQRKVPHMSVDTVTDWKILISALGSCGELGRLRSPAAARKPLASLMTSFLRKLRSGEDMPASAAELLAELIDGKAGRFSYQFKLIEIPRRKKKVSLDSQSMGIGLQIEQLVRDKKMSVNAAVSDLSDYLSVDIRTIWRRWRKYKQIYPENYLAIFEKTIEEPQRQEMREIHRHIDEYRISHPDDSFRTTDKK